MNENLTYAIYTYEKEEEEMEASVDVEVQENTKINAGSMFSFC